MKQNKSFKMSHWVDKLLTKVPDCVTGKTEIMQQKCRQRYGDKDCSNIISAHKRKTLHQYLVIFLVLIVSVLFTVAGGLSEGEEVFYLDRPKSEKGSVLVPMTAHLTYKGFETDQNVLVKVKSRQKSRTEKEKQLKQFANQLKTIILGENEDLLHISKPLNLIEKDQKTGIVIDWETDRPDVINEKGQLDLIHADGRITVNLSAMLKLDEITEKRSIVVKTVVSPHREDIEQSLSFKLKETIREVADDTFSQQTALPDQIGDEISVRWKREKKGGTGLITGIAVFILFLLYLKRYDGLEKELKRDTESILSDLPDFANKLVLLLNAGMVVSSALIKIADDYEKNYLLIDRGDTNTIRKIFYEELNEIKNKVYQSNASMMRELVDFAQRSGIRELIRLTFIISDNWNKGSTLAEKLEAESGFLWISRKKRAEEKGHLAETKLTFPLVVSLMILIIVTIAPAMMVM